MGVGLENAVEISNILRDNNIPNEIYKEDAKIKAKLNYANNLEIPYVIIIGEEEVEKGLYTLKDMSTGSQELLSVDDIIKEIIK